MLFKLTIALIAIFNIAESSIIDPCRAGPSYYCQSVHFAEKCDAFDECLQNVWTKETKYNNRNENKVDIEQSGRCYDCVDCLMPSKNVKNCPSVFQRYSQQTQMLIENKIPMSSICLLVEECKASTAQIEPESPQDMNDNDIFEDEEESNTKATTQCVICEFAMSVAVKYIQQNSTEPQIEKVLQGVCKEFPTAIKDECSNFVATYGPIVISLLVQNVNADKICQTIRLCPKTRYALPAAVQKRQMESVERVEFKETIQCSICVYVAEFADNLLKQNKTEVQITKELELVCNFFSSTIKSECVAFLDEYGPYVLAIVAKDLDPKTACQVLKLCTKKQLKHPFIDMKHNP